MEIEGQVDGEEGERGRESRVRQRPIAPPGVGARLHLPVVSERWKDAALATFAIVAALAEWASGPRPISAAPGLAATLAASVALFWRPALGERLLPIAIAAGVVAAVFGGPDPGIVAMAAVYTIGTMRTWRYTAGAWAIAVAADGLDRAIRAGFHGDPVYGAASLIGVGAVVAVPGAIGLYLGARRAYVRSLIDRAEDLERERELLAREAVSVERARIARELHDVVAHHVSVMVIQAGAAEAQLPAGAQASAGAIAAIRETGREALAEMRRLLGLLRDEARGLEDAGQAEGSDGRTPQPGLGDLPVLIARMREAGVEVSLEYAGSERPLPPAVDLSAFRIAQEALTNTLRHAGPGSRATLRITFEPAALLLEALDDGPSSPAPGRQERQPAHAGHGLVGMRERVALFDGSFEAGPRRGGGYRVVARFPIDAADESSATGSATRRIEAGDPGECATGPSDEGGGPSRGRDEAGAPAAAAEERQPVEAPASGLPFDRSEGER